MGEQKIQQIQINLSLFLSLLLISSYLCPNVIDSLSYLNFMWLVFLARSLTIENFPVDMFPYLSCYTRTEQMMLAKVSHAKLFKTFWITKYSIGKYVVCTKLPRDMPQPLIYVVICWIEWWLKIIENNTISIPRFARCNCCYYLWLTWWK